jgi:peptidoglycan/LPS O-acetylase OafA/YrhL
MPTCSVAPASVVLAVGGSAAATLTVSTIKGVACPAVVQGPHESGPGIALGAIFLLSLLPLRRRGRGHSLLALLLLSLAVSSLAGCSKSSSTPSAPICQVIVAPPAGAYTVVVTAADTSGSPTAKATIALTVQ